MTQALEYTISVAAPPSEVFRAFTHATPLRDWLCDVSLADGRIGGRLYLWWNRGYYAAGEYTVFEPDRRISFTWMGRDDPGRSEVDVHLKGCNGSTDVRLVHGGLGEGDGWEQTRAEFDRGWTLALENLQSLLETGQDLRYTRRPMLGVTVDEFNPQIAAELGVPVNEGVRLTSILPDMGAAQAGLQANDILVDLEDGPLVDYPGLVTALQGKRAGDAVSLGYYRGSDYRRGTMILSPRILPEIPETPAGLAAALREMNARLMPELREAVEGLSDKLARVKPDAHDWSPLEVIAHLVVTERETHGWLSDMINDDERFSDRYTNATAVYPRVDAIVTVHPTVEAMLSAVRDALTETEAMVEALPAETVARRGNYWRIGHSLLQNDQHWEEHIEQVRATIAALQKPAPDMRLTKENAPGS